MTLRTCCLCITPIAIFTLQLLTLLTGVQTHLAAFGSGGWRNSPPIVSSAQYRSQIMPRIFGGEAGEKCVGGGSYSVTGGCTPEDNALEVHPGDGMEWNDAAPQQYQLPFATSQRQSGVVAGHYQLRKSALRGAVVQAQHPQPLGPAGLPSYKEVISRVSQRAPAHTSHPAMHSYPRGVESGGGTGTDRGVPSYLQAPPRPTFSRPAVVSSRGRTHVYAG